MKIVQLIYSLSSGGAERFVVDLSNELARQGHDVHIVIFRDNPGAEFYRPLIENGVKFHNMGIKEGFGLLRVFKVIKTLHSMAPDIVHCHLNVVPYIYFYALLCFSIKFFHTLHNTARHTVGSRFQLLINRFFYKRSIIRPISISGESNDSYAELYRLPRATLIPNGRSKIYATDFFCQVKEEVDSYLSKQDTPIFVHVARYHPSKNQDLLVSVFNHLFEEGTNFLLLVIGNGYFSSESANTLREKACESIKFLGEKQNVGDYLLVADAFCLTSFYEGLPISLLEALSAGCVPICTRVGGISDVITDGVTGYLSDRVDFDSYYNALKHYLASPASIKKSNLSDYFSSKYSIEKCASMYISIF